MREIYVALTLSLQEGEVKRPEKKETFIAMVPISNKEGLMGLMNLRHEIIHTAEDKQLFPLVGVILPEKWLKLEGAIISYRQNLQFPCVTYEEFADFAERQCSLGRLALRGAIKYLDTIGRLKYFGEIPDLKLNVALDQKWLAKLMKLLFRHDYESYLQYRTEYFDKFFVDEDAFLRDTIRLKSSAVLSLDLLR